RGAERDARGVERGRRLLPQWDARPSAHRRGAWARRGRGAGHRAVVRLPGSPARPRSAQRAGVDRAGRPQAVRGGRAVRVGAPVAASGRDAVQGEQVRAGLELWAQRTGADLVRGGQARTHDTSSRSWQSGPYWLLSTIARIVAWLADPDDRTWLSAVSKASSAR